MSDYLLLKITVLEHASVSENCRLGEDIITIICDPAPTPTPTSTITQTPTNTSTPTNTATNTPTNSVTPTNTATPTVTATVTPTNTQTSSVTPTVTPTNTVTPTVTASVTATNTVTPTVTSTVTPTLTRTNTLTPTNTSTPTVTPTVTPTSSSNYFDSLIVPSGVNYISGNGLTFVASYGDILSYNNQIGSDLPATMNISVSGVVRASVTFPNAIYINKPFRFTLKANNTNYISNFTSGTINFN